MSNLIEKTKSAYEYPLLIKQLFEAPLANHPDQEIIYRDQLTITYKVWKERVHRLANALTSIGVVEGNTVAVMDWDSHRYLEAYYAIPMIGAVLHTINVRLSPEQMVYTIDHAEDDVIICHTDFLPLLEGIRGRIAEGRKFILIDEGGEIFKNHFQFEGEYEKMLADASPEFDFPDFDENTRATTFYTTGTTGLPKGVYFSHRQLVLHTLAGLSAMASSPEQGRFHRGDVYMPITPMYHVHAWGVPYMATLMGVKQVYPGRYDPAVLLGLVQKEKVTFSHCVPTILHMILGSPAIQQTDLSKWKVIIGGSTLPKALCKAALAKGIDIFTGYGMSETCPVLTLAHLSPEMVDLDEEREVEIRCKTGRPLPLVDLRIVDETMGDVPHDGKATGEIVVRAPWLTQGYLKDARNSAALWAGEYLHTGDVASIDELGYVQISDRIKDVIKTGGEWISSLELEDIVSQHPSVSEVAVIGVADEKWGERPTSRRLRR